MEELNIELITKLQEIIDSLVELNKRILSLLAQHESVEKYGRMMSEILSGNDVIMD